MMFSIMSGCGSDESTTEETSVNCSGVTLTYASDVNPIVQASCAKSGCHASGSTNGPGPLVTYAQVYASRNEIFSAVSSGSMPKDSRLSSNEKSIIMCWIENGASNNWLAIQSECQMSNGALEVLATFLQADGGV